jgi:hypothetical protein
LNKKKNEKLTESDGTGKTSNWVAFGISVLQNFILTLFIGLLGANFIFLTSSNIGFLDKLLPTDKASYFPTMTTAMGGGRIKKGGGDTGGENYSQSCVNEKKNFSFENLKIFGIGGAGGWPYKYKKNGLVGFGQDFLNWIIETIYGAFSFNRSLLKTWLEFFSKKEDTILSNDTLQILFIAPITLMASLLVFPIGFFVSLFKSFTTQDTYFGLIWAIMGIFLGYTWILSSSISIVQFIQYLLFLIIIPLITNLKMVKNIIHCNIKTLGLLFGALVCGSAISTLDYVTSSVMIVVYLLSVVKAIW